MSYEEIKYSDGSFRREWRDEKGRYHRENGPAIICYYSDGSIKTEAFYINGESHRESGPVTIHYKPDGSIYLEAFYLNGKCLDYNKEGFWELWDNLTEEQRKNPELLKCLSRFS
jgi:hypothetical protein